jgi:hypothetical protein
MCEVGGSDRGDGGGNRRGIGDGGRGGREGERRERDNWA